MVGHFKIIINCSFLKSSDFLISSSTMCSELLFVVWFEDKTVTEYNKLSGPTRVFGH